MYWWWIIMRGRWRRRRRRIIVVFNNYNIVVYVLLLLMLKRLLMMGRTRRHVVFVIVSNRMCICSIMAFTVFWICVWWRYLCCWFVEYNGCRQKVLYNASRALVMLARHLPETQKCERGLGTLGEPGIQTDGRDTSDWHTVRISTCTYTIGRGSPFLCLELVVGVATYSAVMLSVRH